MIWAVIKIGWQRMLHGKLELLLTFVVPVAFFTIFAMIFDKQMGTGGKLRVRGRVVDNDQTETSQAITTALTKEATVETLKVRDKPEGFEGTAVETSAELVRRGTISLAVIIPIGWTKSVLAERVEPSETLQIELLADTSNPIAPKVMAALVQRTASEHIGRALQLKNAQRSRPPPGTNRTGARTPQIGTTIQTSLKTKLDENAGPLIIDVKTRDVLAENKVNPVVSMYAAGIAVMFLLFSATGHSGSLLDEEENQTLERLMCSRLSMSELLFGKWCWLTIVGSMQVTVMFVWAHFVFGVDLFSHIPGFALMTFVTAGAASSFALFLAAACRTRAQLNAVSIILILTMSALGGSMVPRYIMSERMQEIGHYTFNAWALDGFTKVFWRDLQPAALWRETTVLGASAVVLLISARVLARRWETE